MPRFPRGRRPLIGMVHLGPLPGSPRCRGTLEELYRAALRDATILAEEGFDGILVENLGDAPFYPAEVPPETVAAMAVLMERLRSAVGDRPAWGVNVLRNDARAALALAAATRASFIRVNVHCGVTATDQGLLSGRAHETMRLRAALAPGIAVFADARVKHGRSIHSSSLEAEVRDLCGRGLADAILITGNRTGEAPSEEELEEAGRAAGPVPVLAASGVNPGNVAHFLRRCDGIIVGTALKRGGRVEAPIDRARARRLLRAARESERGAVRRRER